MKVVQVHSHLGGSEILKCSFSEIDHMIDEAIVATGSDFCTKVSKERNAEGGMPYDSKGMNIAFKQAFNTRGFVELKQTVESRVSGWGTSQPSTRTKQIDFVCDRVFVQVQLGEYSTIFHDMAKFEYFYRQNQADVGVEIVPSVHLQREMSSDIEREEMELTDIMGLQRQFPIVPVKIIFVEL